MICTRFKLWLPLVAHGFLLPTLHSSNSRFLTGIHDTQTIADATLCRCPAFENTSIIKKRNVQHKQIQSIKCMFEVNNNELDTLCYRIVHQIKVHNDFLCCVEITSNSTDKSYRTSLLYLIINCVFFWTSLLRINLGSTSFFALLLYDIDTTLKRRVIWKWTSKKNIPAGQQYCVLSTWFWHLVEGA